MNRQNLRTVLQIAFLWLLLSEEYLCLPTEKNDEPSSAPVSLSRYSFRGVLPVKNVKFRQKRQDNGGGIGGLLQTAAQDGIASTSAFTSPTMFVGGFSMMMQPMPNGTEFAGQLMNAIPHYTSLLSNFPGFPGAGRQDVANEK